MCYAIPGKITDISGDTAIVDYGGVTRKANVSLIDNATAGDHVLVHAGFVIERIDKRSAEKALSLIESVIENENTG